MTFIHQGNYCSLESWYLPLMPMGFDIVHSSVILSKCEINSGGHRSCSCYTMDFLEQELSNFSCDMPLFIKFKFNALCMPTLFFFPRFLYFVFVICKNWFIHLDLINVLYLRILHTATFSYSIVNKSHILL